VPKLPRISGRQPAAALAKAGFTEVRRRGSHATFHNAASGAMVVVPVSPKDMRIGTLADALKQARLSPDDLARLL